MIRGLTSMKGSHTKKQRCVASRSLSGRCDVLLRASTAILVTLLFLSAPCEVHAEGLPAAFRLVAENESLQLFIDDSTAAIAVRDKREGALWFSNPRDIGTNEVVARGASKTRLEAQFVLGYFAPGDKAQFMDSKSDCVNYGQHQVFETESGVKVTYLLGQTWLDQQYLPGVVSREHFENEILQRIGKKSDRELFLDNYLLLSFGKAPEGEDREKVNNVEVEEIFGEYTLYSADGKNNLTQRGKYLGLLVDRIVWNTEDYKSRADVTAEDIEPFRPFELYVLNDKVWAFDVDDMIAILKEIGYTPHAVVEQYHQFGLDEPEPNPVQFGISIEYSLEGTDLVVRIPHDEISYPVDVEVDKDTSATYPLHSLDVLPYFGAANTQDEGYIFVPDGAGALIYLNNGKIEAAPYVSPVYGRDEAVGELTEKTTIAENVYLPIYGMHKSNQGFLAIIEDGAAISSILAGVAGRTTSYNSVYPRFTLIPYTPVQLRAGNSSINTYQSRLADTDITIRYRLLVGGQSGYMGMAEAYRKYLIPRYRLGRVQSQDHVPLYLELLGAVHDQRPILGIPWQVTVPLTTFGQARDIVSSLLSEGVSNIKLRYSGWLEGGVRHAYPDHIAIERTLGGKAGFLDLQAYLNDVGAELYPAVGFLRVYRDGLFDGFRTLRDGSRFLDRRVATLKSFNPATYAPETGLVDYILSPRALGRLVARFLSDAEQLGIAGLSPIHIGSEVYSDFNHKEDRMLDRQQSVRVIEGQAKAISDSMSLMVGVANDYMLPYVSHIIATPAGSSRYEIFDEVVPFYQLALHGYVGCGIGPINLADDPMTMMLKCLETGSYPYFLLFASDGVAVKNTDFDHLFAAGADLWATRAAGVYAEVDRVLGRVQDDSIADHRRLSEGVYKTTFESGLSIVVNYNRRAVSVDGLVVDGKGWLLLEEGLK